MIGRFFDRNINNNKDQNIFKNIKIFKYHSEKGLKMDRESAQENAQMDAANDFENEMNMELESRLREAETSGGIRVPDRTVFPSKSSKDETLDSDDEDYLDEWNENVKDKKSKQEVNDDLFYDPNMDDEDQAWVEDIRKDYSKGRKNQKQKPLPNSDAVLNCPACFVTLSLDCQRHDKYESQYRAMFVMNCTVDSSQQLKYPEPKSKRKKSKKKAEGEAANQIVDPNDLFHPVKCDRCSTQVAVYDTDEIYHFFNVLASY